VEPTKPQGPPNRLICDVCGDITVKGHTSFGCRLVAWCEKVFGCYFKNNSRIITMKDLMIEQLMMMLVNFNQRTMRWDGIRMSFYQQMHPEDKIVNSKEGILRVNAWVPCREEFEKLSDEKLIEVYNSIHRKYCAQY
jgi:hypothetical protein